MDLPPLLRIPAELRLMIYSFLFNSGFGNEGSTDTCARKPPNTIFICNGQRAIDPADKYRRSKYYVLSRFNYGQHRCYETTYFLSDYQATTAGFTSCCSISQMHQQSCRRSGMAEEMGMGLPSFCVPLMRACRKIYTETAAVLYGAHTFDFGSHVEAVAPFLSDLTPATRALVTSVALAKTNTCPAWDCESARAEWRACCAYLRDHASVTSLRLSVQVGRPPGVRESQFDDNDIFWLGNGGGSGKETGEGPKTLSVEELQLLLSLKSEQLMWIEELVSIGKKLKRLQVWPENVTMPWGTNSYANASTGMLIYAAFSGAVDSGAFGRFLEGRMGLGDGQVQVFR
ncbi:hypothetical protein F5Y16DRAFT_361741 [Xylariaceae sp. FL0255]|nr:hypothetical protein F5Y16DRAFT_361741 [Xylariaceae sp. FL0255]